MSHAGSNQHLSDIPAASLTLLLVSWQLLWKDFNFCKVLEGPPVLGDVPLVLHFLHLLMTVFIVSYGVSNALEIVL